MSFPPLRHSGEGRNPGRALPGCLYAHRLFPVRACCHSSYAGMYSLNHWIPAFAGMTQGVAPGFCCHDERAASGFYRNDEGGCGRAFVRHGQGAVGLTTNLFSLRCHSGGGRNPGEGAGECKDGRVYRMPVSGCRYYCHSRLLAGGPSPGGYRPPQASAERACLSSACLSALAFRAVAISTRTNLIDVLGCN